MFFLALTVKRITISQYSVQHSVNISSLENQLYSHLLEVIVSQFMNAKRMVESNCCNVIQIQTLMKSFM